MIIPFKMNKDFFRQIVDKIAVPTLTEITGTIVTVTQRINGILVAQPPVTRDTGYTSDYWKNQPDGETELYIGQGGIYNRIPREEKNRLLDFISFHFENKNQAFNGIVKLSNYKGIVTQVRIEPRY